MKPSTTVFTHNTPPAAPNGEQAKHQTALKSSLLEIRPVFLPTNSLGRNYTREASLSVFLLFSPNLKTTRSLRKRRLRPKLFVPFYLQENMKLERAYASLQRKVIDNSR